VSRAMTGYRVPILVTIPDLIGFARTHVSGAATALRTPPVLGGWPAWGTAAVLVDWSEDLVCPVSAHRTRAWLGQCGSRLHFPTQHLDYAHRNGDQDTDCKNSDRNSDRRVLIELPDHPDNSPDHPDNCPPRARRELKCEIHRLH
jgi:hypothetical protein